MDCNVLLAARGGRSLVSMCDWRDSCKCLAWNGAIAAGMLTLFDGPFVLWKRVDLFDYFVLCVMAVLAGAINAIAGGGTLLTFPALVSVLGSAPDMQVIANATNTVASVPARPRGHGVIGASWNNRGGGRYGCCRRALSADWSVACSWRGCRRKRLPYSFRG